MIITNCDSTQWPDFCDPKNRPKIPGGTTRKIWLGCAARFLKPLPYFRPKSVIFPALFQTWSKIWYRISDLEPGMWLEPMTSCYGTYTVVGINIKREMVLSPNDEEVANSSKKHTQFKTRRHKPYPVSDQNGRNWYPISNQKKKTIWHGTYLYSLQVVYKGLPPPPPHHQGEKNY